PPSSMRATQTSSVSKWVPKPGDRRTADSPVTIPSRKSFCPQPYPVTAPTPQMDTPVFRDAVPVTLVLLQLCSWAAHSSEPSTLRCASVDSKGAQVEKRQGYVSHLEESFSQYDPNFSSHRMLRQACELTHRAVDSMIHACSSRSVRESHRGSSLQRYFACLATTRETYFR